MRIVVTGTQGQIAQALQECASPDVEIVRVARPLLDLSEPASILPALRAAAPDLIINAAAYTAVDLAEANRDAAFAVNEAGARAVAEAAATLNAPIIHLSTDYVFDGRNSKPYVEGDAPAPINVYGASKRAGEIAVADATPKHLILRLSWVYGPHAANFPRTMLRLARERDAVRVVADQIGHPMSATMVAPALIAIAHNLLRPDARYGLFHLGGEGETSWADFAESIFAESKARGGPHARVERITTAQFGAPAPRPARSVLNGAALLAAHGVSLPHWRTPLGDVVARLLRA